VAARISSPSLGAATYQLPGVWTAAVSHRWQRSDRHFVGDIEQEERQAEDSQIINNIHIVDLSVSYAISKRVTATLAVPFSFATRRHNLEDERLVNEFGNEQVIGHYYTEANGLGDVKLLATTWLLKPERNKRQNISLGIGVKFPTGEKDAKDEHLEFDEDTETITSETREVDNSIQPGDGAWGIIVDLYGFHEVVPDVNVFAAATYILTPEEDTGVKSTRGRIWSTGDSYLFRAGAGYTFLPQYGLTLTLGGRMEGTPSEDLIGGSEGRRRPGFAISVEPGIVFAKNGWFASLSAPIAVYRNRERSVDDERTGDHGDAAFADFMTLFSLGRSF
jgi:hypothetical protein